MVNLDITEEQVEWLPIARFIDKQLVDKFANYVGVQLYKQSTTIDGGKGKLLELTYRCKEYDRVGCAFKMFAKKAAATNSKVFLVYRSGTHICGHHFFSADETDDDEETDVEESEEESILEEESEEESILEEESEESTLEEESEESTLEQDMANIVVEEPTDAEESDEGVVEIDDDGSGDENLDLDSDKTDEGSSANMDEAVADKEEHMAMQHYVGNGPRAAINNFDNKDRGAALQKMIQDGLGLVFKGLMVGPAEVYFVSDAKNTGFASARTMLTLRLLQINSASAPMISMVEVRNGVRDSANGKFEWLIPDFDHFLWAVRGLCISAFFPPVCQPSNSQQSGEANTSSGKARRSNPQVHEQNGNSSAFSVLDLQHPKLCLDELAAEMGLSVQKHGGGSSQTRLIFEPLNTKAATSPTRLHVIDGDGHVTLVEYEKKPTNIWRWRKKLGTQLVWTKVDPEYFRYALLGKAMDVFHPNHGKQ